MLNCEGHRRGRNVHDDIDVGDVIPFARNVQADVGLVLMVGPEHFYSLASYLVVEVGGGHSRGNE